MSKLKVAFFLFLLLQSAQQLFSQVSTVAVSGIVESGSDKAKLPYVNVVLKNKKDSSFVTGTVTNEEGRFLINNVKPGNYLIQVSFMGYESYSSSLFVGSLSPNIDIPAIVLLRDARLLREISVIAKQDNLSSGMDKKTYTVQDNISQSGGSVLQSMQNLPGVTVQEGKVQLRGSDKVTVLIDGRQTALTGFGNQIGLDNIPASAIDKIEVINNPSAKYEANGNAGIINIVIKKEKQEGLNGKVMLTTGLGALWERKENLPTIRPQYTATPKINPSLALNYRKDKINLFVQADNLYTQTLNKNEYVTRTYDDGQIINSQLKRNRNTNFFTGKAGIDWNINSQNTLTISGLYGSEKIIDRGDQPFFNGDITQRLRLWQFLEDELKTTAMATASYQHKFKEAGHLLNAGFNYTFHREDEKYFYDNYLPNSTGTDAFKLLSDEKVYDVNLDYIKPFRYGRIETGLKLRNRNIPTNMNFIPGQNSVLDVSAGGWANYKELIPAWYGNYIYENEKWEAEAGLRVEYVKIQYDVNPNHSTYKSDGYNYTQPFPNLRLAYKLSDYNKLSVFYNRRVDRPNEVDIRIFPKYDDAEIIKVGNPALKPQFTNSLELGYKHTWDKGYVYSALYHRFSDGTITRISSIVPGSTLVYAVFQNAGKSYNSGIEGVWNQKINAYYSFSINGNIYRNQINAFSVESLYPKPATFSADKESMFSGNIKLNNIFRFAKGTDAQLSAVCLAPDIIPQGRLGSRFSVDMGVKKSVQSGKGELFFNATDLLNTMVVNKEIRAAGFRYTSNDYYETQVIRLGYSYKF
ncbi:TonB-dependent receptor plug [Pseudopedobacter saltans DSM 12145]|uniref:TonB-dependent receptor plug n=1 Tax=Pseudopedobacter saltans (strain ATCC 51119 / DSM 12145 / JCM 21818 / CCUG 39354 / LMG 10337 / NBRC 100064 / NCIMB 13643) TaxID=762903 RepID=F0S6N6_PSESL|nr:TonB-dependent receptor [Pseudopedobacter saltans]ADY51112.1 TonB-dependent receptor plug [Pseudopedobacter saltans DSM 12145]